MWLSALVIVAGGLLLWTLFRGAPYVPTKRGDIDTAFGMMNLKPGDTLVDLGSGDGIVLKAAAAKGYRAVGYEINPLLVLISRWRLRKYPDAKVFFGDFRHAQLPSDTKAVYIFSAGAFVTSMRQYLGREVTRLGHPVVVVSYGFRLPDENLVENKGALMLYRIRPKIPFRP
jgi:hypothetical protein